MNKDLVNLILEYIDTKVDDAIANHKLDSHDGDYRNWYEDASKIRNKINKMFEEKEETVEEKPSKIPSYGDLFTIEEFKDSCDSSFFTSYDGHGYYATQNEYFRDAPAIPEHIRAGLINHNYTHVLWFNA